MGERPLVERLRASGCALCSEAADAIERERKEHNEEMREAQREVRDAVAEARWEERQGEDYGSY